MTTGDTTHTQGKSADGTPYAYATGDPATWPDELDATVAAPQHHRVLLENDEVRVLEVFLAPGATEPPHHHRWSSVLCLIEGSDLIDHDGATGEVVLDTREFGGLTPIEATAWKEPEALHYVSNPSDTESIRLIRVELKNVPVGG
ncbi:hypothetical protein ACWDTI_09500 [Gordonia sp. NPDC003424]